MSTDYTHFDKLAFNRLFSFGPDGSESLLINSLGVFVGSVGTVTFADGTVSAPGIAFANATSSGLYRPGANSIAIAVNGVKIVSFNTQSILLTKAVQGPFGSIASPGFAFSAAGSTGIVGGTSTLQVSVRGVSIATYSTVSLTITKPLIAGSNQATINSVIIGSAANTVAHVNTLDSSGTLAIKANTTVSGTLVVSSTIGASNFSGTSSGTNSGDVTIGTANGLSVVGQALSMAAAGSGTIGAITASAQSISGSKTMLSAFIVSANTQNASSIRRYTNAGDGTGQTGLRVGNSGSAQGDAQFFYTNAAATGSPATTWTFTPRNNADGSNTDACRITLIKTAGSDGGEYVLQTATTGGTLTNAIAVTNTQECSFGTGTGATHRFNSATGTAGAVALTTLNGPTGTSGNPNVWLKINVNGTSYVFPGWSGAA